MADAPKEVMVRLVAVIVPLNILVLGILFASMRTSSSDQGLDSDEKNQSNLMKSDSRPQAKSSSQDDDINSMMDVDVKGTKALELCRAIDVNLENATKVIGIKIAGQARAYVVDAFHAKNVREAKDLAVHVVYDSIGSQEVCVTHCNITHSSRVFTSNPESKSASLPFDLTIGGFDNCMLLRMGGKLFRHHATTIPLSDVGFMTTTWDKWRVIHPDTLVYTGQPCLTPVPKS